MVVLNDSSEQVHDASISLDSDNVKEKGINDERIKEEIVKEDTVFKNNENLTLLKQPPSDNRSSVENVEEPENGSDKEEIVDETLQGKNTDSAENVDLHELHFNNKSRAAELEHLLNSKDDQSNVNQGRFDDENAPDKEAERKNSLPIDRGWAWVILLASVYTHFIVIGQLKCFGIVFVQLQKRYESSSSSTSLIYTLMNATYSVSALIIMTMGASLSARTSVFIGAVIASIASIITAFIDDVNIAMVTIGVASGVSNAFIMTLIATIVNTYFVEKRGFANNVGNCGVSLGTIALAPIVTKLFEYYSYTGTYIIITGLNLQIFVIACLLTPMSFYTKFSRRSDANTNRKCSEIDGTDDEYKNPGNGTVKYKLIPRNVLQIKNLENGHIGNGTHNFNRQLSENVNVTKPTHVRRRRAISECEKGALGFTSLVQGVASGICMPIVGYLRDSTGTYTYPYNFIGSLLIIGAIMVYFIPNVHEWSINREKLKDKLQKV